MLYCCIITNLVPLQQEVDGALEYNQLTYVYQHCQQPKQDHQYFQNNFSSKIAKTFDHQHPKYLI